MKIRNYQEQDLEEILELFYGAVHVINRKDYSQEQIDVWAPGLADRESWNASLLSHYSLVAEEEYAGKEGGGRKIIGFGDIDDTGYLDRLYVHKDYQGQGIASALCQRLEKHGNWKRIRVHASITARPFFEKRGYKVKKEQQVERKGILLTNYAMEKETAL